MLVQIKSPVAEGRSAQRRVAPSRVAGAVSKEGNGQGLCPESTAESGFTEEVNDKGGRLGTRGAGLPRS